MITQIHLSHFGEEKENDVTNKRSIYSFAFITWVQSNEFGDFSPKHPFEKNLFLTKWDTHNNIKNLKWTDLWLIRFFVRLCIWNAVKYLFCETFKMEVEDDRRQRKQNTQLLKDSHQILFFDMIRSFQFFEVHFFHHFSFQKD